MLKCDLWLTEDSPLLLFSSSSGSLYSDAGSTHIFFFAAVCGHVFGIPFPRPFIGVESLTGVNTSPGGTGSFSS